MLVVREQSTARRLTTIPGVTPLRRVIGRLFASVEPSPPVGPAEVSPRRTNLSHLLGTVIFVGVCALLVDVVLEGWVVDVLGGSHPGPRGQLIVDPVGWPKTIKTFLYFALTGLTAVKITVDRGWGRLRTKADLALVGLGVVLVLAGIFGPSQPGLIAGALYVYLRGVVVFYALRTVNPSAARIRQLLWILGGLVALESVLAFIQLLVGAPAYRMLGWKDLSWAKIGRAQGLMDHPNDIGHLLGLVLLGLLAVFAARATLSKRWWAALVVIGLAFAGAQSRESILAVLVGAGLIIVLSRAHTRRLLIATGVIILAAALPVVVSADNRAQWVYRLTGLGDAFLIPDGSECAAEGAEVLPDGTCKTVDREIRVLYFQQGARLLAHRPLLGYGVGQFGGIVATQSDPNWADDPRFQPVGFDRHGFDAKTVDSFWLHLTVETGVLGVAAYLVWIWFLAAPLLTVARRRRADRSGPQPRAPAHPAFYWALASIAFVGVVALLSASLEDPLVPPLLFTIVGIAWVLLARGERTERPAAGGSGVGGETDGAGMSTETRNPSAEVSR